MTHNGFPLQTARSASQKVVSMLEKAATVEPKMMDGPWYAPRPHKEWPSGKSNNLQPTVTFQQDYAFQWENRDPKHPPTTIQGQGSLERFAAANRLPREVYDLLRVGLKTIAAGNGAGGLALMTLTPAHLASVEKRMTQYFEFADRDHNGVVDPQEFRRARSLISWTPSPALMTAIGRYNTDHLQDELRFSKQVNFVLELLFQKGDIRGPDHVRELAQELPAPQAAAVWAAYTEVSRYVSKGATDQMDHIWRGVFIHGQKTGRQELQRALMRTFGAPNNQASALISALELPPDFS
jgi:hypothetical protein